MGIFEVVLLQPILNFLILLSNVFFNNFGLAIIVLTVIVRFIMLPLTMKQMKASKKMQDASRIMQPKLQALKKKYAKDPRKLQEEQMKLYKESGISPLGCLSSPLLVTMAIQMPIFIALYRAIVQALAATPQDFLRLSESLYSWSFIRESLPISGSFLWLNLSVPDPYFIIPILVMAGMWLSQKMMTTQPATDPQQQSMQNMMQIMMPLMFGFITFTLPAGLGLYFLISSLVSMVIQGFVYGWRNPFTRTPQPTDNGTGKGGKPPEPPSSGKGLPPPKRKGLKESARDAVKNLSPFEKTPGPEEGVTYAGTPKPRSKRQDG